MILKEIQEEIHSLENIKILVQTYEEIAASRMQKVKASVLHNRDFLSSLYEIYQHVKYSYNKEIENMKEKSDKAGHASLVARNGKTVAVLLTANTGLYGEIIRATYEKFRQAVVKNKNMDIVVIGNVGKLMLDNDMESLGLTGYKYFQISDNASGPDDFVEVVKYVVGYQKVVVYHGQFESLLAQIPTEQIVTGELPESEAKLVEQASYLFEPSLEVIIGYFESEIMASIFEQTIHESSLSKYASRMINLDRAVVNVQENIKKANYDKQKLRHSMMNKKQLGMLASMSLWTN